MIHDTACPPALEPAAGANERHGVFYTAAQWTPPAIAALARHLDGVGRQRLARIDRAQLEAGWNDTVAEFRDPRSEVSTMLRPTLARFCQLSPEGLDAALEAILGGVTGPSARELFRTATDRTEAGMVAVFLAGNLPALAVQPLLPALTLRRPVLLKSPTGEPLFAAAFVRALHSRLPDLADSVAALTWRGGDEALEAPLLEAAGTVVAYGGATAVDSLERRAGERCVAYGPRASIAVVAADEVNSVTAAGLAADVALLDQRGCLSIQAIYTDGDARRLADLVAGKLIEQAALWPPGPLDPTAAAAVHQVRTEARMRGLHQPALDLAAGTVIVEPLPTFQPSPGLRSVRIHGVDSLTAVLGALRPAKGTLQGAALAGEGAWALEEHLGRLGVSRCAPPGHLQSPDALWHNGGRHPLAALARGPAGG